MIKATPFRLTIIAGFTLSMSGCLGGGSNNVKQTSTLTPTPAPTPVPVVVGAGATYTVGGTANPPASITQTLQLSGGVSSGLATTVTYTHNYTTNVSTLTGGTDVSAATVTVTPTNGAITNITQNTPNARLSGSTSSYSGSDLQPATVTNLDACAGGNCATSIRDLSLSTFGGFKYLAYGSWFEESGTSGTVNGVGGFLVVGAPTAPASIPVTGTASYRGASAGSYINSATNYVGDFGAEFNATAAFADRSIAVSTTNTFADEGSGYVSRPAYNYSGTLTYAAGSNQFSGPIATTSGLSGTATGLFFGPAAQEIGGVFNATGGTIAVKGFFVGKQ